MPETTCSFVHACSTRAETPISRALTQPPTARGTHARIHSRAAFRQSHTTHRTARRGGARRLLSPLPQAGRCSDALWHSNQSGASRITCLHSQLHAWSLSAAPRAPPASRMRGRTWPCHCCAVQIASKAAMVVYPSTRSSKLVLPPPDLTAVTSALLPLLLSPLGRVLTIPSRDPPLLSATATSTNNNLSSRMDRAPDKELGQPATCAPARLATPSQGSKRREGCCSAISWSRGGTGTP